MDIISSESFIVAFTAAIFSAVLAIFVNIIFFYFSRVKTAKEDNHELFYKIFINKLADFFYTVNAFREDEIRVKWGDLRDEILVLIEKNQHRLTNKTFLAYRDYTRSKHYENHNLGFQQYDIYEMQVFSEIVNDYTKLYPDYAERQMSFFCLVEIWSYMAEKNNAHYWAVAQCLKYHWVFNESKLNIYMYRNLRDCKVNNNHKKFIDIIHQISIDLEQDLLELFEEIPDYIIHYEDSMAIGQLYLLEHWATRDESNIHFYRSLRERLLNELYNIFFNNDLTYEDYFSLESSYRSEHMNKAIKFLVDENLISYKADKNLYEITSKGIIMVEKESLSYIG